MIRNRNHELAQEEAQHYNKTREINKILTQAEGKHFIGVAGHRGVGKTVLSKQMARDRKNSLYISVDTLSSEESLFEIVKKASQDYSISYFLLDEVQFRSGFSGELKKVYDFLDVKITFTSSMALAMYNMSHDLSRRVQLHTLYPFSYREYLNFENNQSFPVLSLRDLLNRQFSKEILRSVFYFDDYLAGSNMPLSLEEPQPLALLGNILNTIIEKDIPAVASLYVKEIDVINKVLKFIGQSEVDGISYSSISRNCGITKYKAEIYTSFLEQAFVLHRLFPKCTNVLKEPKIIIALPYRLLFREKKEAIGPLREDFFISSLRGANIPAHYLKDPRGGKTPDYAVNLNQRIGVATRPVYLLKGEIEWVESFLSDLYKEEP